MFDGRWREAVDRSTRPVGAALYRHGITADVLTATGLISATGTAVMVASGHLHIAIALLILTGMHDLFDGPVAKAAGTASVRGAFFDSVTDRVADAVLMAGVAWFLIDRREGHLILLPFAVLAVTTLVSYERAKAESLGLSAKGGLMERAERMVLLGVGFLMASFLVPVLWVMFGLILLTAISRFVKVWNAASGRDEVIRRRLEAWRESRARADSRWRTWREGRDGAGVPRRDLSQAYSDSMAKWRARRQESARRAPGAGPGPGSGRPLRPRRLEQKKVHSRRFGEAPMAGGDEHGGTGSAGPAA
ncbi:MAG TPA: CDP-alcohol phosphatidyltransferase family protein [Acidimicrobiales bacterium]|nr:CDP-alcohol phosphatidyltransferase family protein [Acidimicrobiales bacterium]